MHFNPLYSSIFSLLFLLSSNSVSASRPEQWPENAPSEKGNCISGTYKFDSNRVKDLASAKGPPANFDYDNFDFLVLEKGKYDISNNEAKLSIVKDSQPITKMAWSRWIKYGKISLKVKADASPGIVTTFITMSERGDEIDWEILGVNNKRAESSIFYKGIEQLGVHGGIHELDSTIDNYHTYTMDWKDTTVDWYVDGKQVRQTTPDIETEKAKSGSPSAGLSADEKWFPTTVSQVQFSVWQANNSWAGYFDWTKDEFTSSFAELTVQCYDDNMSPVSAYPPLSEQESNNNSSKSESQDSTTSNKTNSTNGTGSSGNSSTNGECIVGSESKKNLTGSNSSNYTGEVSGSLGNSNFIHILPTAILSFVAFMVYI